MTDDEFKRDREVIDAATSAPWAVCTAPDTNNKQAVCDHFFEFIARTDVYSIHPDSSCEANAAFIARARTRWPAALDEIERLRALVFKACSMGDDAAFMRKDCDEFMAGFDEIRRAAKEAP